MSYQVFARKYRPQTFEQVIGQEHITQTLRNAIQQNRLAHAYLFVGPRGIGKTSTARILAKALNCVQGPTATPCNQCDSCREITIGNNLDVLEIDGASNNGVEQVRELRENVQFAPTRGQFRIYIIDEVHMLSTAAFNALLKTLEEPPPHVKFIFATTEAQKVLPTILSRCQRFDLRRIPAALIARHLRQIAASENIDLSDAAAHAVAKGADGGLRDAESMLDQLVAFCGEKISELDVMTVFGFTASETVANITASILEQDTSEALKLLNIEAEAGKDLSRLMSDLITHLRNVLVAQVDVNSMANDFSDEFRAVIQHQAEATETARILTLIDQFGAAEGRMRWAPNKKLHFEIALIRGVQSIAEATLEEVIQAFQTLQGGAEPEPGKKAAPLKREPIKLTRAVASESRQAEISTPIAPLEAPPSFAPPPRPTPVVQTQTVAAVPTPAPVVKPSPEPEPERTPEPEPKHEPEEASLFEPEPEPEPEPELGMAIPEIPAEPAAPLTGPQLMVRVKKEIELSNPMISAFLQTGAFHSYEEGRFTIAFPPEGRIAMESLTRASYKALVEAKLTELTGAKVQFLTMIQADLVVEPDSGSRRAGEAEIDPMEELKNDPLIKKALESFKATEIESI